MSEEKIRELIREEMEKMDGRKPKPETVYRRIAKETEEKLSKLGLDRGKTYQLCSAASAILRMSLGVNGVYALTSAQEGEIRRVFDFIYDFVKEHAEENKQKEA